MQVGMTDTAVGDIDADVIRAGFAALERPGSKRRISRSGGNAVAQGHGSLQKVGIQACHGRMPDVLLAVCTGITDATLH